MYKLKEHEDFVAEVLSKSKTAVGAMICSLLKEGFNCSSRLGFYRYIKSLGIAGSRTNILRQVAILIEDGIVLENKKPNRRGGHYEA